MRTQMKKRILALGATMEEAGRFIVNSLERDGAADVDSILEDQRQSALKLAEIVTQSEGEGHPSVKMLQEHCALLWQCIHEKEGESRKEQAGALLEGWMKIEEGLIRDVPVRYEAVFLPYKASMWDSLESVWLAAREDKDWDCYVMPIPYFDRNRDHTFGSLHYEGNLYPEYVPVTPVNEYNLEVRHPDVIFIHNPYDENNYVTSVYPAYYSSLIKSYTDLLVYIPYFICVDDVPEWHCTVPGVLNSNLVIVQSEKVRQTYIRILSREFGWDKKTAEKAGLYEKIRALGSPKTDKLLNTPGRDMPLPEDWRVKIYGQDVETGNPWQVRDAAYGVKDGSGV